MYLCHLTKKEKWRIWVKRPNGVPISILIDNDTIIDDLKQLVFEKYPNSLGKKVDPADLTLSIELRNDYKNNDHFHPENKRNFANVEMKSNLMNNDIENEKKREREREVFFFRKPDENVMLFFQKQFPNGYTYNDSITITINNDVHNDLNLSCVEKKSKSIQDEIIYEESISSKKTNSPQITSTESLKESLNKNKENLMTKTNDHNFISINLNNKNTDCIYKIKFYFSTCTCDKQTTNNGKKREISFLHVIKDNNIILVTSNKDDLFVISDTHCNHNCFMLNQHSFDILNNDLRTCNKKNALHKNINLIKNFRAIQNKENHIAKACISEKNEDMNEKKLTQKLKNTFKTEQNPKTNNNFAGKTSKKDQDDLHLNEPLMNKNLIKNYIKPEIVLPSISVLVVEDNAINLAILGAFLRKHKITYEIAKNGQEAVDKWKKGGFHLVLMDIQLPIKSGIEVTKEIRSLEKLNRIGFFAQNLFGLDNDSKKIKDSDKLNLEFFKSPVIIVALTASSNFSADKKNALMAGCNDYLLKPVNLVWLQNKLIEWGCMQALIDFDGWKNMHSRFLLK